MEMPEHFEVAGSHAFYRPLGNVSLIEAISLVSAAITYTRESQIPHLLVDVTQLTGFSSPTTLERFTLAGQFARAAQGAVKVVMVVKSEMIDPDRFGVTVARNRGLLANVFATEAEALAWLLDGGSR